MEGLIAFVFFAMGVLASLGLFMSGIAAMRQARLAKRMFHFRMRGQSGPDDRDDEDSEALRERGHSRA